jgi:type II secretory pathway pseudopilin PulG
MRWRPNQIFYVPATRLRRRAFSLIEAMVALAITSMAGAVLLLSTEGVLKTTNDAVAQTIAQGMALQLIDEVLGSRYCALGASPYDSALTPSGWEKAGPGRSRYNDTDDYHLFNASPPTDPYGIVLGKGDDEGDYRHTAMQSPGHDVANWRQRIEVYYVDPNNPTVRLPNNQPTDYRAVEVTIERTEPNGSVRPLAKIRRVFCYVPIP